MADLDLYTRGSTRKAKQSTRIVTLPGKQFCVAGKLYDSLAEAQEAERKLAEQ